jgi:lambda repressor-like predicted transcriptional regulator
MTPTIIRHELKKLHVDGIQHYAESIGYSDQSIYGCINGHRYNSRVAAAIAQTLGMAPEEVWGEIYPDRFSGIAA